MSGWRERRGARFGVAALVSLAAFAAGCGGGSSKGDSTVAAVNGCRQVEPPPPKTVTYNAPEQTVSRGEKLTAVVKTTCGRFEISLDTTRAPKTTNSFVFLAEKGFYNDLTFHRVASGFVIQGGDPLANGSGGPPLASGSGGPGYRVVEKPPANLAYTKGLVAMARSMAESPGTSGSQFFVVLGPDIGLPPNFALLGKVTEGFDAVRRIERLGTRTEKPKIPVVIESITIQKG